MEKPIVIKSAIITHNPKVGDFGSVYFQESELGGKWFECGMKGIMETVEQAMGGIAQEIQSIKIVRRFHKSETIDLKVTYKAA